MEPALLGHIRALRKDEIEDLKRALGAPVDREYLRYWISQSIEDAVQLAYAITPAQMRNALARIEGDGRKWLNALDKSKAAHFLSARADLANFKAAATRFCDRVASLTREVETAVGRGPPRRPAALELFVERMLGIAKRAGVLPSTPSRRLERKTAQPPAFFGFLVMALRIARQVIKTSPLPEGVKRAALSKLPNQTRETLIEIVVRKRGRIADYVESNSKQGLVVRPVD
jgi:hypothetical protein